MATRAEVRQHAETNRHVRTLAVAALVAWWRSLDLSDPKAVRAAAVDFLPGMIGSYADLSATNAAEWYESLRTAANAPGTLTASLADPAPTEQLVKSAQWATGPLYPQVSPVLDAAGEKVGEETTPANPDKALERLSTVTQRHVRNAGRDTVARNVTRDPADARWARVPQGAETCAWCLILASRGPVYGSEHEAQHRGERQVQDKYHDFCDCEAVPIWRGQPLPEGYDPDHLYSLYENASKAARGSSINAIAAAMREQLGVK